MQKEGVQRYMLAAGSGNGARRSEIGIGQIEMLVAKIKTIAGGGKYVRSTIGTQAMKVANAEQGAHLVGYDIGHCR